MIFNTMHRSAYTHRMDRVGNKMTTKEKEIFY